MMTSKQASQRGRRSQTGSLSFGGGGTNSSSQGDGASSSPENKQRGGRYCCCCCVLRNNKRLPKALRTAKSVGYGRLLVLVGLLGVAAGLVALAYALSKESVVVQAQGRFESVAERALVIASLRMEEKKYSANALAHMAAAVGPLPEMWPNVAIPNYAKIAASLRNVTQGEEMIFCPLIHPRRQEEQELFEAFAYDYIYSNSSNSNNNETTATGERSSSFGRGIFSLGNATAPDNRYHDTTGDTVWNSPFPILVPAFQFDQGYFDDHHAAQHDVMKNLHQEQTTGQAIDRIIKCSLERSKANDMRECGSLTDFIWNHHQDQHDDDGGAAEDGEEHHHAAAGEKHHDDDDDHQHDDHDNHVHDRRRVLQEHIFHIDEENNEHAHDSHHDEEMGGQHEDHGSSSGQDGHTEEEHSEHGAHHHGHGHGDFGGPEAMIFIPIYPQLDETKPSGFIAAKLIWEEVLAHGFASDVTGLTIVLQTDHHQVHTFDVTYGVVKHHGEGDHHDPNARFHMGFGITNPKQFNEYTPHYRMDIYSTDEFIDSYDNVDHPWIFLIAGILLVPTLLFFLYDFYVRREFNSKRKLLEAKRQFVRIISHEVRTPLNTVCIGLTLLREDLMSCLGVQRQKKELSRLGGGAVTDDSQHSSDGNQHNEEQLEEWLLLASQISESAETGVQILTDLLNFDKIQMGTMVLEEEAVAIMPLLEKTHAEFKIAALEKKVHFVLDFGLLLIEDGKGQDGHDAAPRVPVENVADLPSDLKDSIVVGDTIRLSQILRNLISNGLKFTKESGQLTIQVSRRRLPPKERRREEVTLSDNQTMMLDRDGQLIINVVDDGVGMTQEQVNSVFHDGVQFNPGRLQAGGGAGLGLNIAKAMAEQHNGSLTCSSKGLDKGTTFTLSLPMYQCDSFAMAQEAPSKATELEAPMDISATALMDSEAPAEHLQFLVVDDSVTNRKLCMKLLKRHGHTCVGAEDGKEALEIVQRSGENAFDCILLDFEMPRLNGPDACRQMRELGCSSFIVGVTGNVMTEDVLHFRQAGANWVLPKPFRMEALEAQLVENGILGGDPC